MNERIKQILVGASTLLLLTFLLLKTNSVDSASHLQYSTNLRQLKELDGLLDKNLLELRFGTLDSDLPLKSGIVKIDAIQEELQNIPAFLETAGAAKLRDVLRNYENANAEKDSAVLRFTENNVKIKTALREFNELSSEFQTGQSGAINNKKYAGEIDDLSRVILEYYYSSSDNFKSELESTVVALKKAQGDERSGLTSEKIDRVLGSARVLLEAKPERDRLIKYTLGIGTDASINELVNFYQAKHFEAVNLANIYRLVLYAFTILLVGYGFHVLVKMRRMSHELFVVNENLEGMVDSRTNELLLSNIELQQSEGNNRALLGALPDTMWKINGAGVFLEVIVSEDDDQHSSISDWSGKNISDILTGEQGEQALILTKKALDTKERQDFEFYMVKNFKTRHYECRMVVCGSFEVLVIVRDITELKQAQAESHLISEIVQGANMTSNLEELLELIHNLISRIIYAENCFVALYDDETDSLDLQLFVDKYDAAPQKLKLGRGLTAYVVRTGEPAILTGAMIDELVSSGEIELVGTPPAIWVGIPLKTPQGTIGALVVQHYEDKNAYNQRDVELLTAIGDQIALAILRKKSENALKASEIRFQQAFDYAPIGICLTSIEGKFQQVNMALCDMLGFTKDELLNVSLLEITERDDQAVSLEKQKRLVSGEISSYKLEQRFVHKSGEPVLAFSSVSLVRDFKGAPIYFIAQIQDVSEQKSMEDQLQRAQKLESIGQLAAGIAHEINTPTQYVGDNTRFLSDSFEGYAQVLEKNKQLLEACRSGSVTPELISEMDNVIDEADIEYLSEEIPVAISQALHGVERISKIVQSMKEFAHPGSLDKKAADLNKAIESTITVASNEWKYVADLKTDFDPDLPATPCLVGEFNQVILNMIINASHAIADVVGDGSSGKGTISVTTTKVDDWAEIRIGDTGSGMPDDIRKRIFDPFFTTKVVGKGTGQGLAISHNVIVEKHSGMIEVESEVGKGTTFVIRLPINGGEPTPAI